MEQIMGVINLDMDQDVFNELTYFRSGATVPFAGRYRLIDFVLSNMVGAGISDVAIFVRKKYRSLMDHIGNGEAWDLDRKTGGIFILPPDWNDPTDYSKGDLQHFHNNLDFFHRGKAEYVVLSGVQQICHINYEKVLEYHKETEADVTLIYKEVSFAEKQEELKACYRLTLDEKQRVLSFDKDLLNPKVFMNMYLLKKDLLLELLKQCIARGAENFLWDGIIQRVNSLQIQAYAYDGFLAVLNSTESYYRHSMNLLNPEMYRALFTSEKVIYTKVKDEAPAKYLESAEVKNSMVANGCIIEGNVENSILFRGVHVQKGVTVKNSIVMQRCVVGEDSYLEHVILDKDVHVSVRNTLIGSPGRPYTIPKRQKL